MLPQYQQQPSENYFPQQLEPFHQYKQNNIDQLSFDNHQTEQPSISNQEQNKNQQIQEMKQNTKPQSPFQISHNQQPPSSRAHFHQEIINQKNKEAIEELQEQMNQFQKLKDTNQNLKFDQNQNYFEESCKLFIRNSIMSKKIKEALAEKNDIVNKIAEFLEKEKENESLQTNEGNQNSEKKKRFRRSAIDINRHYKCPAPKCDKSYGSEGSLSQHLKIKHPDYCGSVKQLSKSNDEQSELQQIENKENIENLEEKQQENLEEKQQENLEGKQQKNFEEKQHEIQQKQNQVENGQVNQEEKREQNQSEN